MQLIINGAPRDVPDGLSAVGLLEHLKLQPERVAVEINEAIVKRAELGTYELHDGDVLEILNFVGGG